MDDFVINPYLYLKIIYHSVISDSKQGWTWNKINVVKNLLKINTKSNPQDNSYATYQKRPIVLSYEPIY